MIQLTFNPEILHIVGPFSIHAYGIFVALGIIVFVALTRYHPLRSASMSLELYEKLIVYTTLVALAGARVLHIASEWQSYHTFTQMIALWNGGLSILGAIIAGLIFVPLFLRAHKIAVLPILDVGALYLPLTQAVARLGCLFAGCCFGALTTSPWSIIYTHSGSHAPLNMPLFPTQLYSSLIFLGIFILLQAIYRCNVRPGTLAGMYIVLSSIERFVIDFFRGDRIMTHPDGLFYSSWLSFHQWISLCLIGIGIVLTICSLVRSGRKKLTLD